MAIVEMSKLGVIGLNDNKNDILKGLMALGVCEINSQDDKLSDNEWAALIKRDSDENATINTDIKISEISSATEVLNKYFIGKKPLIACRKPISEEEFNEKNKDTQSAEDFAHEVNAVYKKVLALKAEENTLVTKIAELKPWIDYDFKLSMKETKYASIIFGTLPDTVSKDELEGKLSQAGSGGVIEIVSKGEKKDKISYVVCVCLKEDKEDILDILRQDGFNPTAFEGIEDTPKNETANCEEQLSEIRKKITFEEEKLKKMSENINQLELYYDSLIMEKDRYRILSNVLRTDKTFYFDGWVIKSAETKVKELLDKYGCYYEFSEPEKGEQMPILLKQNSLAEPFQAITDLYSTPSVNDIAPTPFLAPFYFIFFGLMLSDAAYGLILTVGSFIALKMYRLEGMMKRLVKMFMFCGISTFFWGVMFGGYFGDMFGISPAWFDPIKEPMRLLVFSLVLGAIHLFVGMALKAYILIKNGQAFDAFCDIFLWYILLIGVVVFGLGGNISPAVTQVGKIMTIVGAVGILLTGGRSKKGIGKITGGLGSLYGITSYLSDVLSYSRLLALGLATGVVSQVINTLGKMVGGGVIGVIVMVIVFVIGHTFNLAINTLGTFVHSSRLQYVEFFGKFFEGGGTPFNPFMRRTKYVEIVREEK